MKFEFTEEEAQVLLDGLVRQPYERVHMLIPKFVQQVQENRAPLKKDEGDVQP